MRYSRKEARRVLLALRAEMLAYLERAEDDTRFCRRCLLPLPEDSCESYDFCPWCANALSGFEPCLTESRRIVESMFQQETAIQCGECGSEYEQPARYPFRFCVVCGAHFSAQDEMVIELPWVV
jgi:hypothetical protein